MIPLDALGMVVGFTGLVSLIVHNWSDRPKFHIITYVFAGAYVTAIISSAVLGFRGLVLQTSFIGVLLVAGYGDWALGVMSNNLLGVPSGDSSALYWSYFILKRLTMFSS
jgi:hypothetical protein